MTAESTEVVPVEPASAVEPAGRIGLLVLGRGPAARCVARVGLERGADVQWVRPCSSRAETPSPVHFPTLWRLVRPQGTPPDWQETLRCARLASEPALSDGAVELAAPVAQGEGRFVAPDRLELGGRSIRFRRAIVVPERATPPLESPGAEQVGYWTEETLDDMQAVPATLAIVGSGVEACQWAQVFRQLGSQVHLVCPGGRLLPQEQPEIASLLQTQLGADQIRLHLDTAPPTFERMGNRKAVLLGVGEQQRKLLVDEVLHFGTKRYCLDGLGLPSANVEFDDDGIRGGVALGTSNRRVFVVNPLDDYSPLAVDLTARVAVHNALVRWGCRLLFRKMDLLPRCLHTRPAVTEFGLRPSAAPSARYAVYRTDLGPWSVKSPACESGPTGPRFVELVIERRSGRVAGVTIVAQPDAPWLAPLALLIERRLPLETLAGLARYDPCWEPLMRIARLAEADRPSWRSRLTRVLPAGWGGEGPG